MEVLGLGGTRVKIEADSDASFFGSSSCQLQGAGDMDLRDHLDETYFPSDISDLDFALLQDLTLPNDYNLLDDICMQDECHSNSASFTSEIYLDPSSSSPLTDSPPLTPPSSNDSDGDGSGSGSVSSPSPCQVDVKLKKEPNNNVLFSHLGKQVIPLSLPKSSRGRSASHDSPDVQALKRHIRMIRNRESACLSRKKKKDHVTNLENRIADLERENNLLKQENAMLKSKLGGQQNSLTSKMHSNDGTRSKSTISKTSAVAKIALLGLCCFVFISFRSPSQYNSNGNGYNPLIQYNMSNLTSKTMRNSDLASNSFINLKDTDTPNSDAVAPPNFLRSRRSFGLWETGKKAIEEDYHHNNISSHPNVHENTTRNLNVNMSKEFRGHFHNPRSYRNLTFTQPPPVNKCPTPFNQTEALRVQNDLKGIFGRRTGKKKVPTKPLVYSLIDLELRNIEDKGLTIYNEKMRRFSSVLDQLQQREDTFYVVSLAFENQILLSAKAHNASTRPKMSFVMPWKNETLGGKEEVMQIDCEVTRVQNLNIKNGNRRKKN